MSGFGRRLIGMWAVVAAALAVVLGLYAGGSSGSEQPRTAQAESWDGPDRTVIVRVLGPVLY